MSLFLAFPSAFPVLVTTLTHLVLLVLVLILVLLANRARFASLNSLVFRASSLIGEAFFLKESPELETELELGWRE